MKRLIPLLGALAVAACATVPAARTTTPPQPVAWRAVEVTAAPVPLNSPLYEGGAGAIAFAGGVALSADDAAFAGLSDLKLTNDGRLFMVSDRGALVQAKLLLDAQGRLTGVTDVHLRPVVGMENQALSGEAAKPEALAILPDGRLLVGFERQHRLWIYDPAGNAPAWAPNPTRDLPADEGIEGVSVSALPEKGPKPRFDYLVSTYGGALWRCAFDNVCGRAVIKGEEDAAFALTALDVFDREDDAYVAVYRAFDEVRGMRIRAKVLRQPFTRTGDLQVEPLLELNNANTVGDVQGVAVDAARPDGSRRLYLLTDGGERGRTLLLAFDVR
jgi:hypothetical protein